MNYPRCYEHDWKKNAANHVDLLAQNPKKHDQELKSPNPTFVMAKKDKLREEMKNILCQVIKDNTENVELVDDVDADNSQQPLENS